jgi:hypothetical protein
MYWIYNLPIWLLGLIIVGGICSVTCAVLVLIRPWVYRYFNITSDTNEGIGVFLASMGMLYGLLLGLTAVSAWENFDSAEEFVNKEASSITLLYKASNMLDNPIKALLHQEIKDYLNQVINVEWTASDKSKVVNTGAIILTQYLNTLSTYHVKSVKNQIYLTNLLAVYDQLVTDRRLRLLAEDMGVPFIAWVVILTVGVLIIVISFLIHLPSIRTHLIVMAIFSVTLGLMIFLMVAIDNPFRGVISISSDAYSQVLKDIQLGIFDPYL